MVLRSGAGPPRRAFSGAAAVRSPGPRVTPNRPPPPPQASAAAYQRQRRKEWVIVGVAGSAAAFGGWYYWANIRTRPAPPPSDAPSTPARPFSMGRARETSFSIPVRESAPGQPTHKVITPLTPAEVDARLRQNERSTRVDRPSGACLVARYDTNQVASNDPIEDKRAEVIVERDRGVGERRQGAPDDSAVRGDLCFFTVMDGHAGSYTASLLSQKLIAFVALELDKVFRETGEYAQMARSKASMSSSVWRSLFGSGDRAKNAHKLALSALDGDPEIVTRAITKGFRGLDKEIVNTPLELLKEYELSLATDTSDGKPRTGTTRSLSSLAHSIWPSSSRAPSAFTASQNLAYESLLPALSGSCALMVYVDSARRDLYVACTGDSRAVAGYWDERAGRWELEPLSIDQTGRNPDEVRRIQREHPSGEASNVVVRGRVLGGLEPTRAFGDARYKWDKNLQGRLYDAFLPGGREAARPPPRNLETPPYVTAEPVVQYRHVPLSPASSAEPPQGEQAAGGAESRTHTLMPNSGPTRELRFIIMATDGLWDLMSNQEAVGLVAGHLAGIRGTIRAADLQQQCFEPSKAQAAPSEQGDEPQAQAGAGEVGSAHHPLRKSPNHLQSYTFEDDNLSTHLLRNALGGAARERVGGLLAIPSPESRRYRDDITVNVILFNTGSSSTPRKAPQTPTTPQAPSADARPSKM